MVYSEKTLVNREWKIPRPSGTGFPRPSSSSSEGKLEILLDIEDVGGLLGPEELATGAAGSGAAAADEDEKHEAKCDGQGHLDHPVVVVDDPLGVVLFAVVDHLVAVGDAPVEPVKHQLSSPDHHVHLWPALGPFLALARVRQVDVSVGHAAKEVVYLVDAAIYAPFVRATFKLESVTSEQGQTGAGRVEVLDGYHRLIVLDRNHPEQVQVGVERGLWLLRRAAD